MDTILNEIAAEYGIAVALSAAGIVIGAALLFKYTTWFSKPDAKSNSTALDPFEKRINDIDRRVERIDGRVDTIGDKVKEIEGDMSHLATKEELSELKVSLARSDERMKSVENVTKATRGAVGRIEEWLIKGAGK